MSKRRKNGHHSRYQQDRRNQAHRDPLRLDEIFGPMPDLALAQLFRSPCPQCGFDRLHWFTGADATSVVGEAVSANVLGQMPVEWRDGADCWTCRRCGETGAFGPNEWEPF